VIEKPPGHGGRLPSPAFVRGRWVKAEKLKIEMLKAV
jgi:hypothetical protein